MRDAHSLYGDYAERRLIRHCLGSCPIRIQLLGINAVLDVWRSSVCVRVCVCLKGSERGRGKKEVFWDESSEKPSGEITVPPPSILLVICLHSYEQAHTFLNRLVQYARLSTETKHTTSVSAPMTRTDQKKMAS